MSFSFAILCYLAWLDDCKLIVIKLLSARLFEVAKISNSTFSAHFLFIWYESYQMHEPIDYNPLSLVSTVYVNISVQLDKQVIKFSVNWIV